MEIIAWVRGGKNGVESIDNSEVLNILLNTSVNFLSLPEITFTVYFTGFNIKEEEKEEEEGVGARYRLLFSCLLSFTSGSDEEGTSSFVKAVNRKAVEVRMEQIQARISCA